MKTNFNLKDIQISANGRNVRYQGKALDKCAISSLIKDVALIAGHPGYVLWSDIYWYSATKADLVNYLRDWMSKVS